MTQGHNVPTRFDADLISLRALVAIADSGSFSAAARQIGRTQSAVSLQIAKLEERLDVRLLERNSRSVRTTSAGETLISYARRVISLADEAMSAVSAQSDQTTLRLGMDDFHNRDSILACLKQFNSREPLTPLQLHFDDIDTLQAALTADKLDLVVGHTLMGHPHTGVSDRTSERTVLLREPLVWAASSAQPGEQSSDQPGAQPSAQPCEQQPVPVVLQKARSAIRQAALDTLNASGITWRITVECNCVSALQSAVRAGLGIAALPLSALGDGVVEASTDLPNLPASALFVDVATSGKHPEVDRIVEQLKSCCEASLPAASATLSRQQASAVRCHNPIHTDMTTDNAPLSTA